MDRSLKASKSLKLEAKITKRKKGKVKNHATITVEESLPECPVIDKSSKPSKSLKVVAKTSKEKVEKRNTISEEMPLSQSSGEDSKKEESSETIEGYNNTSQTTKIKRSKVNTRNSKNTMQTQNKKIKFDDDDDDTINNSKQKKYFNDEEAEVKDEDIDKYCEEIDEEDNKQYETWVQLFEANFSGKKKK